MLIAFEPAIASEPDTAPSPTSPTLDSGAEIEAERPDGHLDSAANRVSRQPLFPRPRDISYDTNISYN